jgi:hypothetical protein
MINEKARRARSRQRAFPSVVNSTSDVPGF